MTVEKFPRERTAFGRQLREGLARRREVEHARLRRRTRDPQPVDPLSMEFSVASALDWLELAERLVASDDPKLTARELATCQALLEDEGLPTGPMPRAALRLAIHLAILSVAKVGHMIVFPDDGAE